MFAAVDDVAGELSETEREFAPKVEKRAEKNEESAEEEKRAAEFSERVHNVKFYPEATRRFAETSCAITIQCRYLTSTYLYDIRYAMLIAWLLFETIPTGLEPNARPVIARFHGGAA